MTLIVFASLTGADAVCCADGCRDEPSSSQQHTPESPRGICLFCLGGVDTANPRQLPSSPIYTSGVSAPSVLSELDEPPHPVDHPPRS
jgi:hypothetical protein